ncbi:hypothetical protein PT7_1600 [Pusillimonas sp. T7-7]|uniref:Bug family tripartite tricarboxylate transporter substrate binding protein n=1 Tax=Pusillimonas sp. (strain T7-7) TaxID=1007105 RepID=UPI0002085186|nr:tripartite tricarboxylate transporter substrate binding protein [Pusillimonas sp. T7-7]AEC20140.1 hypothetical protein PT7_1600 [Pusillimonas sp. T7-7]
MDRRTSLKTIASLAGLSVFGPQAMAQEGAYPARPIHIVVPYPPGGVTDLAGRLVGDVLTRKYDKPVIVENRPGAAGLIGQQRVAASDPDGYTLMLNGLGGNVLPPVTVRGLPIDIVKAFVPIAGVAEFVNVLIVGDKAPVNSVQELAALIKKKGPDGVSYASAGIGSSGHLTSELFSQRINEKLLHIPYQGGTELLIDVANGNVDFCFANLPSVLGLLKKGSARALAVTSDYRSAQLPDVPTMQESGLDDFNVTSWLGIYGPAGIPADRVVQIGDAVSTGVNEPDFRKKLLSAGFEPKPRDAQEFAELNTNELARWAKVAEQANIVLYFGKAKS